MSAADFLDRVRYRYPCPLATEPFEAGCTVRRCAQCDHDVVDLSAMTRAAAERLLRVSAERPCVRVVVDSRQRSVHRPSLTAALLMAAQLVPAVALAGEESAELVEICPPNEDRYHETGGIPDDFDEPVLIEVMEIRDLEDLAALEAHAMMGRLGPETRLRLERHSQKSGDVLAEPGLRLLLINAEVSGDRAEWSRLLGSYVARFGASDPDLAVRWITILGQAGEVEEAARLARLVLSKPTPWTGPAREANERILQAAIQAAE
jgi:hypothetical protein